MNKIDPQNLKNGDILFCQGNGIIAKGIRIFTGSKYTHVAVVLVENGNVLIVDAQIKGVFPRTPRLWQKKYNYTFEVYRRKEEINNESFIKRCKSQFGTKYDVELFAREYPIEILKGKAGINSKIDNKFEGNGKFICSEFGAWCHAISDAHTLTPKSFKAYCDFYGWNNLFTGKF